MDQDSCTEFELLLTEELQAIRDHQLALQLSGLPVDEELVRLSESYEAHLLGEDDIGGNEQRLTESYETDPRSNDDTSSDEQWEIARTTRDSSSSESDSEEDEAFGQCDACLDKIAQDDILALECDPLPHNYCRECLTSLIMTALNDTSLFPPRCCNAPIPLDICRDLVPKDQIKKFDLKVEEHTTPNPTYCADPSCAAFIRVNEIEAGVGSCAECDALTCAKCNTQAHDGLCPEDYDVQLLLEHAKQSKWQLCATCKNMVELATGCFHITCRCGHQFCYLCGVEWKHCDCPQFDVDYLIRLGPDVRAPPAQAAPIAARAHDHHWTRLNGGRCQACAADYLQFVMHCAGCGRNNCWRCIDGR